MSTRTLVWVAAAAISVVGCDRDGDRLANNEITVTGCLQPAEQGLAAEPNAAAPTAEGVDRFVLSNADAPAGSASAPGGSTSSTEPLYVLQGEEDELRKHAGHLVEVKGELEDDDRIASSDRSDTTQTSANMRRLEVESVRMIAPSCTPQSQPQPQP